jgi:saccharopine dehydrogenase-like NADP-dependent oxidoreductase
MRVLVLGCGEMGESAVQDLYEFGPFDEIVVGTRSVARAREVLGRLSGRSVRTSAEEVDVKNEAAVAGLMAGSAVVVNCAGPNYQNEVPVARAALRAKVNLVDINDDYETTYEMLALDAEARAAGIAILLGLGASPGVNNVLVRAAADQLDAVEEIHTAWVMSATDPGGPALSKHLIYSLSGRALTFRDGTMVEVQSFVDGRERIAFPEPVGEVDVFHIGHPEPITLARTFPGVRYADDKATFLPASINDLIVDLGRLVRESPEPILLDGRLVDPMDFAAAYFQRRCRRLSVPKDGALRVEVLGWRDGRRRRAVFSTAGRISQGTGIPAAVGAVMVATGRLEGTGVLCPEAAIDAHEFLYELFTRRDVAKLNGWAEDVPETERRAAERVNVGA